jgi:YVTN family beta-propeller protein
LNLSSVDVGGFSTTATYDSGNGWVYVAAVAEDFSGHVSVLNGTVLVGSLNVGNEPLYSIYDSANGFVYVANYGSDNVTVIDGVEAIATIPVGSEPCAGAYDGENGFIYISSCASDDVAVISGIGVVATLNLGGWSRSVTYAPSDGYVYVATCNSSDDIAVISATTILGTIAQAGGSCSPSTYDSRNGYVYFVNSDNVSLIGGRAVVGSVSDGGGPAFATYDAENGYVYVWNGYSNTASVIDNATVVESIALGINPDSAAYDVGNGDIFVSSEFSSSVSVLNGTAVVGSVDTHVGGRPSPCPTTLAYSSRNGYVYLTHECSSNVTVLAPVYNVTFAEAGLPSGTAWSVNLSGTVQASSSTTNEFSEPNGTYAFAVRLADGYVARPWNGTIDVRGTSVSTALTFVSEFFRLWLNETGLPAGSSWSAGIRENCTFCSQPFPTSSDTDSISFVLLSSADEWFGVGAVPGFSPNPSYGHLAPFISMGAPISKLITFTANTTLWFNESGLPGGTTAGASWSVTVVGTGTSSGTFSNHSVGNLTGFQLPLGFTGSFEISPVALATAGGQAVYDPDPSSGRVNVPTSGASVTVRIHFSKSTGPTFLGLPVMEGYALLGGIIAILAVGIAGVVLLRRKGKALPEPAKSVPPRDRGDPPAS